MRAKDGQLTRALWSAATCRRFPTDTEYHSGDKSPHSKRAVIVQLHLTKAEPEATRTSNYTRALGLILYNIFCTIARMFRQSVDFSKARAHLRELLEEVQRSGRPVTIMRRGKPQAVLLSYEQYQQKGGKQKSNRWRLEGSLRIGADTSIDDAIRAVRESAGEALERRIGRHAPGEPGGL
jgi:prevent-host-death family protein